MNHPPHRSPPSRRLRPYPWGRLDSYTAEEADVSNRLLSLIPTNDEDGEFLAELADHLEDLLDTPHAIDFHRLSIHRTPSPTLDFGDAFVTRFHLPPDPEIGALVLQRPLVRRWLSALDEPPEGPRRFGDVDDRQFGLVTYLLLQLLDWARRRNAPPVVFPTEPPLRDLLTEGLLESERLFEVTFVVAADGQRSLARLYLPVELVRNLEVFVEHPAVRRGVGEALCRGRLSSLRVDLPVAVGDAALARSEYTRLARGDVVMLGESTPTPRGRLYLRSEPAGSVLPLRLEVAGRKWRAEIEETTLKTATQGPEPMDDDAPISRDATDDRADTDAPTAETEGPEATDLLEAPQIDLEVRLGSIKMSIRRLAQLQRGEVLELQHRVGEPAQLVADGRVIGRGELVDVEGQLGVEILNLES